MQLQAAMTSVLVAVASVAPTPSEAERAGEHRMATERPAIEAMARLWKGLDRSRLDPLMIVKPMEPKLVVDESMPQFGTKAQLVATLVDLQPMIKQLIEVSALPIEQFGPAPDLNDENPDAHMQYPCAWIQNYVRILSADASRLWEERQADDAVARHVAVFRFSSWLFAQRDDPLCRSTATGMVMLNCKKLIAKLNDGMDRSMSPAAIKALDDAVSGYDARDPGGLLSSWADSANDSVRWFRQELSGDDGGERYAKYLTTYGVYRGAIAESAPQVRDAFAELDGLLPEKETADEVRGMKPGDLLAALDKAEKLIEPTRVALLAQDRQALREIAKHVRSDRTQLSHSLVGSAGAVLSFSLNTREAILTLQKRMAAIAK